MSYSEERLVVAPVVCTSEMDIWTRIVPLICFDGRAILLGSSNVIVQLQTIHSNQY
jgi:hypothetical protein